MAWAAQCHGWLTSIDGQCEDVVLQQLHAGITLITTTTVQYMQIVASAAAADTHTYKHVGVSMRSLRWPHMQR